MPNLLSDSDMVVIGNATQIVVALINSDKIEVEDVSQVIKEIAAALKATGV